MKKLLKGLFVPFLALCLIGWVVSIAAAQEEGEFVGPGPGPPEEVQVVAVGAPWVGPNTPWVFYNNNWYYNGILYAFFGSLGWWPYGYYGNTLIVRDVEWYGPRWNTWYREHPRYWNDFHRHYHGGHHWHRGWHGHDAWHHRHHGNLRRHHHHGDYGHHGGHGHHGWHGHHHNLKSGGGGFHKGGGGGKKVSSPTHPQHGTQHPHHK
jgi:uncharacterized membrane protein YgcG